MFIKKTKKNIVLEFDIIPIDICDRYSKYGMFMIDTNRQANLSEEHSLDIKGLDYDIYEEKIKT